MSKEESVKVMKHITDWLEINVAKYAYVSPGTKVVCFNMDAFMESLKQHMKQYEVEG